MELTSVRQLFREKEQFAGQKVTVGGWVRSNRDSKNFGFLVVNDGTFFEPLQVVYAADKLDNYADIAKIGGSCPHQKAVSGYTNAFFIGKRIPVRRKTERRLSQCLTYCIQE